MKIPSSIFFCLLFLTTSIGLTPGAEAGAHKEVLPMVKVDVDPLVEAEVTAVIKETARIWSSQRFSEILDLWDPNEPFPTYLGEEQSQWFVGWDRLNKYLAPSKPNIAVEALRQENYDIQVKQIAPDLAIAWFYMHFEMKVIGANPFGEDIRASAVLRKTDKGWKYIHWAESPKNPKVYLEDLMEKNVEPGWDEFFKQSQKNKKQYWKEKREAKKNKQ